MADVYLVGVGGQGIITASRIIGDAAILAGKNVLLSETHGMAQRGGSVVCTARIGDVYSPLIPDGQADVILSFELLEALRALCKASRNTVVVTSNERMIPLSVSSQKLRYPTLDEVREGVTKVAKEFVLIEASRLATEAGVPMSSNIVMIGALAGTGLTNLDKKHFEKAIEMNIARNVRGNLGAFSKGFDAVSRTSRA
jgi:indolepyruvate ferredoxin oxidoreductase beta subunit